MWKGRFQTETSNLVQRYGESISYDWRLYAHDIEGSLAHAAALAAIGAEIAELGEDRPAARHLFEDEGDHGCCRQLRREDVARVELDRPREPAPESDG